MHPDNENLPDGLQDVDRLLREQRAEASPLELDRIKLRAQSAAGRRGTPRGPRFVTVLLTSALLFSGVAAIVSSTGGSGSSSTTVSPAAKQYCPPSSPKAGQPKAPKGGCGP
jgi:hypothetical protein